jgi:hypothetical protein
MLSHTSSSVTYGRRILLEGGAALEITATLRIDQVSLSPSDDVMTRRTEGRVAADEPVEWRKFAARKVLAQVNVRSPLYRRHVVGVNLDIQNLADLAKTSTCAARSASSGT